MLRNRKSLEKELEIPVFHDDQHGTAIACLAGVKAALRFVKKDLSKVKIVVNGAGSGCQYCSSIILSRRS